MPTHMRDGAVSLASKERAMSVAVTGPISLQLNIEGQDTALGRKSGTPLVQGVTTKSERIDTRSNGHPLDPI
jgi:hypothetical protein